jgi:hypothetical protein
MNGQSREKQKGASIMDNPERNWQHWVHKIQDEEKTKQGAIKNGQSREKLATLGTQDTGRRQTKQGAIKNGQSRQKTKGAIKNGQSREKTKGAIKNGQSRERKKRAIKNGL